MLQDSSPQQPSTPASNLYQTGSGRSRENQEFTDHPLRNPFVRPTANRKANAVLALAAGITATLAGWLLYSYNRPPVPPTETSEPTPREIALNISSPNWKISLSPTAAVLADALADLTPSSAPTAGTAPLDISWLKQAAYHVVMGEKAYAEERLVDAVNHFQAALRIYPQLKGVHRYLGLIHLKLKNYDKAAQEFEAAGREEGLTAAVANNIGIAYLALNTFDQAEKYLRQAVQLDPQYANAYLNLAVLARRKGNLSGAAEYLSTYLRFRPYDLAALQAYSDALMKLGRWEEAIPWLERIKTASPDLAPVYFRLATALAHIGRKDEAFAAIDRGVQLIDPQKALAWLSEPDFDPLRSDPHFRSLIASLTESGSGLDF